MEKFLDALSEFYILDTSTMMLIGLFSGWAAGFVRQRIANVAFLVVLYPLFVLASATALCLAIHFEYVSITRTQDWLIFSVMAAAVGCSMGIIMVALFRKAVDAITLRSHIRASVKRDGEDTERGYERLHL
jgi:hypothetical protein